MILIDNENFRSPFIGISKIIYLGLRCYIKIIVLHMNYYNV